VVRDHVDGADSQLLVAASAISHDWRLADGLRPEGLGRSRVTVLIVLVLATALALLWRADIFGRAVCLGGARRGIRPYTAAASHRLRADNHRHAGRDGERFRAGRTAGMAAGCTR
jgi:hypothetical protein